MNVRSPVPVSSWPAEFRSTLALSWPLILGQVSQRLILIVNVVMMGHLGTRELAAGTLALAVVNPLMLCFGGVLTAVAPLTAQAIGSGDTSGGRVYFQQGLWLCALLSAVSLPLLYHAGTALAFLRQDAGLVPVAGQFAATLCLMLPSYMLTLVARNFLAAHGLTHFALATLIAGAALNFALCSFIVADFWGLAGLGLPGIGYATAISNAAVAAALMLYIALSPRMAAVSAYRGAGRLDTAALKALAWVGFPIGGAILLEVAFFSASSLLMGYQGETVLAAYALSGQLNGLAFAIPTGIGIAAMVRVGWAYGAGSLAAVTRACLSAIALGLAIAAGVGLLYALFPVAFIALFLDRTLPENQPVIATAIVFLHIVAVMQIFDALQGIVSHVLRGLSDTVVPLLLVLMGYWVFGFPASLVLANVAGLGGNGVYLGLSIGVAIVSVVLSARLAQRLAGLRAGTAGRMPGPAATPAVSGPEIENH